jgi:hypothetical protein
MLDDWQLEKPEEKAGWAVNGKDELSTRRMVTGMDESLSLLRRCLSRKQGCWPASL